MKLKSYAAQTHHGPYLQVNEDGHDVDAINGLFMVLDGFGGSGIGDKAVDEIRKNVKHFFSRIHGDPNSTLPFYYSNRYLLEGNALINAIHYAHRSLVENNEHKDSNSRGGASGVLSCLSENILTVVSTGTCRAYLHRKGSLDKILQEDDMRFLAKDDYTPYLRTCPMSGFGLFEDIHYKSSEVRVIEGDMICFFSDGVYARLEENEIKYVLDQPHLNLSDKIKNLFDFANNRGNLDNQTAVLLNF